jgi:riboflavin kinase/FMN adenylyltransferase
MKVFRSLESYEAGPRTYATMGVFDGLHRGHQAILEQMVAEARDAGGESLLITYHPHPRLILFPENNPLKLLQTLEEKIETLAGFGLDKLLVIPFDKAFSRITAQHFIEEILLRRVGMRKILIGYDHRFGKNRSGGITELKEAAARHGFELEEIPAQTVDEVNISSSKIRKALMNNDVETAERYLGYPYSFAGEVVHGQKQGRLLGYPTANLDPEDPMKLIPGDGVYVVRAWLGSESFYGMMSIGKKPTMGEFERSHEAHLFGFNRDIYGQTLRVEFLHFIRKELKFNSLEELIAAMERDQAFSFERIRERESGAFRP